MMEKRKPTYDLAAFRVAFDDVDKLNVTGTAVGRCGPWFRTGRNRGDDPNHAARPLLQIHDLIRGSSDLAGRASRAVGGGDALCQIHGRRRDRVFVAVVQGERR